jgi:Putative Actinobacterial Holin-X, holin superfamily III
MSVPHAKPIPISVDAAATSGNASAAPSLSDVAASGSQLLRAWVDLFDREFRLARRSLLSLVVSAVLLPVIVFSAWLAINAALVGVLERFTGGWLSAISATAAIQLIAIGTLVLLMRRWWRDLSLPQSRAALVRAMERLT